MMSDEAPQRSRWKWLVLALAPSILSNLLIVAVGLLMMNQRTNSPTIAERGMWLVYGVLVMPIAFPIYLYPLARNYVREFHGGFKSPIPFVLMFSAANLVIWAGGVCIVGFNMKFEGSQSTHIDYEASERRVTGGKIQQPRRRESVGVGGELVQDGQRLARPGCGLSRRLRVLPTPRRTDTPNESRP